MSAKISNTGQVNFIVDALITYGAKLADLPKTCCAPFEGFDLRVVSTKCCGAHELLDSDLSGSVVKNVTERGERELIAL